MTISRRGTNDFPFCTPKGDSTEVLKLEKADVQIGDHVFVRTVNSVYHLHYCGDGWFFAGGGWFSSNAQESSQTRIAGCTWGGSAIKTDVVAVVGLNLEFCNRVTTSPIRRILLLRRQRLN